MDGATELLDLSRKQRNLLLLRPIFQLERYKAMLGDEASGDRTLFHGIDAHYLALSAQMCKATKMSIACRDSRKVWIRPPGAYRQFCRRPVLLVGNSHR